MRSEKNRLPAAPADALRCVGGRQLLRIQGDFQVGAQAAMCFTGLCGQRPQKALPL
jgi:hypothetical protein